jgi:hypothetical protein
VNDASNHAAPETEVEDLSRRYRALLIQTQSAGPNDEVWIELAETRKALGAARGKKEEEKAKSAGAESQSKSGGPVGALLGAETTGLEATTTIGLQPIPTGIYHLLDPATDPLLTVTVKNESHEPRRVCVTAYLGGLSDKEMKTFELKRMDRQGQVVPLLPSLLPEAVRRITEVRQATLHVVVEIFGSTKNTWTGLVESHDTHRVMMLSRNSSFNAVIDPRTGRPRDLTKYYGAWVTPHVEPVQALVRRAAEKIPGGQVRGYQGRPSDEAVTGQVKALYDTLKEAGLVYFDSIIDFGAGPGQVTQRTRLPRESLRQKSANCIDGTVLFASLLEAASMHAALVLVPGHAFVAWEKWRGSDEWDYLETTMIGTHEFEAARERGRQQHEKWFSDELLDDEAQGPKILKLNDLRAQSIWPME